MATDLGKILKRNVVLDPFTEKVIRLILRIPRGKVATYGQIAELAGKPRGSRQVGFILRTVVKADSVPWQRVIGSNGKVAFPKRNKNYNLQRRRLEREGVEFDGVGLNLDRYRWKIKAKTAEGRRQPRMFAW